MVIWQPLGMQEALSRMQNVGNLKSMPQRYLVMRAQLTLTPLQPTAEEGKAKP
ncbi:hypothetical protein BN439_pEA290011 (plasmid) [Erwinia amylovora Ea644]|nr:hypothetical protein BN439_pEA290011 [Erwinia amylovora Ea644]CCP05039.1 hypothetical protein BN440_pEA290012 [Erwinia amylovora MR1]